MTPSVELEQFIQQDGWHATCETLVLILLIVELVHFIDYIVYFTR